MTDSSTTVDTPHLTFSGGLPGFPDVRTFELLNNELAQAPFSIMKCREDPEIEFVVVPAMLFFPDYSPEIDESTAGRIGLGSAEDALLLVILTVGEEAIDVTANLLGPIVVNQKTNEATQAVLSGQDFELRQPLFANNIREAFSDD
jgi:flagellar assembly factor FliW